MSRHSTSAGLLGFATLCASPLLLAACTTSSGTGNFGSLSSFTVVSTAQTITGTTGFVHRQPVVDPQHQHHRRDHRQHRQSAGHHAAAVQCRQRHLPALQHLQDNGCGTVYNVGSTVRWSSTTFLGILGLFNATDGSLPLYLRTATG